MPESKPHLRVFVTKTGKIRAKFERKVPAPSVLQPRHMEKVKGECTVGGNSWMERTDPEITPEMRMRVQLKCLSIIERLKEEYRRVFVDKSTMRCGVSDE